ncbi:MAG: zinc ABC transporter substrate-binding protein [Chloroflexi bacterium]|nr:zinc ABC transporter substrate-binding protein [Chloroflexota bacterium]
MRITLLSLSLTALLLSLVLGAAGCRAAGPGADSGKVNVVASFYPLYDAARQVGGDKASVSNLVPAGTEPHDFEPTPRDIATLTKARLVVYNGAGFEEWMERVLPDLKKAGVLAVSATQTTELLQMEDEDDPSKKVPDPHVWLDPVRMQRIVNAIKDAYVQVDPANRAFYEANAAAYVSKLDALDKSYQATLSKYSIKTIVTSHNAFGYLARRYGIDVIFISGLSPEAEPSPRKLAEITRLARERGVKYIFFESLVSPRLAETVAKEVGAQTLVLNPIEGLSDQEIAGGKSYITVMQDNLANLKTALEAQR